MFVKQSGNSNSTFRIIWLHGWGQDHTSLLKLSTLFDNEAENYLLDLPGFGQSPPPTSIWGVMDYTKALITWLQTLPPKTTFLVGHSFGGRIAIQAAQLLPEAINGIVLLAAAGLKRKRSVTFIIKATLLKYLAKAIKTIDKYANTSLKEQFSRNFGSRDYKALSGLMRNIFVKIINEDLAATATKITIPCLLIYGSEDQETPPQFGERYNKLIKNARLFILPEFDHYSILTTGRHQVYNLITQFLPRE